MKKTLLSIVAIFCTVFACAAASGTGNAPLTVDELIEQGTPTIAVPNTFVTGYIVGFNKNMSWPADNVYGVPTETESSNSNILLASSSGETDAAYCIPVQLPAGDVRDALNLVSHPENLGKQVTIVGTNEKFFGQNGIKSTKAYNFGSTIDYEVVPAGPVTSLDENFATIPETWQNLKIKGNRDFYAASYQGTTYAKVSGYQGKAPFDIWLISPAVKIDECASKILTFQTQVNSYGSTTSQFKAYVLTSNDPTTATKYELAATLAQAPESGFSAFTPSGDIDLSDLSGEIYIGFNYTAQEEANYATWGLTAVKLNAAGGDTPVQPGDKGTKENPLTIPQITANEAPAKDSGEAGWWVKGYIVGYYSGQTISTGKFEAITDESTQRTNLMLAANANETNVNNTFPVQLPTGAIREALNLYDNPGLLGKEVTLCGTYEKYFGTNGLKKVTEYVVEGGVTPPVSKHFYESLKTDANGWEVEYNIPLTEPLTYVWSWDSSYSNYKASAYVNQAYAADATTFSPAIDLTGQNTATLAFSHTGNKFVDLETAKTQCSLLVREVGGPWENLEIPTWFTNSNWTFVDCTGIDLTAYCGKQIQLGLNYKSEEGAGGTWEVKNLYIDTDGSSVRTIAAPFSVRVANGCIIAPEDAEVYTVNGMRSGRENLQKGIYLVRLDGKTMKVVVR